MDRFQITVLLIVLCAACLAGDYLYSPSVEGAVLGVRGKIANWKWPRPQKGSIQISYPFLFRPAKG